MHPRATVPIQLNSSHAFCGAQTKTQTRPWGVKLYHMSTKMSQNRGQQKWVLSLRRKADHTGKKRNNKKGE